MATYTTTRYLATAARLLHCVPMDDHALRACHSPALLLQAILSRPSVTRKPYTQAEFTAACAEIRQGVAHYRAIAAYEARKAQCLDLPFTTRRTKALDASA